MARSVFQTSGPGKPGEDKGAEEKPLAPRRQPIIKGGAASDKYIKAATQGAADRTYQEISLDQIQDSRIRDRIDLEDEIEEMMVSLKEEGQKFPIIVRMVVGGGKPYEVVVGRRRIAASRRLGRTKINAFVSRMDDLEAFKTQGIENSARLETTFIERARTAAFAYEAGIDQVTVSQSLGISRQLVNLMIKIYENVGEDLVVAIGAARGVGRRKWETLIEKMDENGMTREEARAMVDTDISDSTARFEALMSAVSRPKVTPSGKTIGRPKIEPVTRDYLEGRVTTTRKGFQLMVKVNKQAPPALLEEIDQAIAEVMKRHISGGSDS